MRLLWITFLSVGLGATALRGEGSPEKLKSELMARLKELTFGEADVRQTLNEIDQLDDERYSERRKALAALMNKPLLQRDLLENAFEEAPLDKQILLHQILEVNRESAVEDRLIECLRAVIDSEVKGLAGAILGAFEGKKTDRLDAGVMARQAIRVTLEESDRQLLTKAAESETPLVREAALVGLAELPTLDGTGVFLSLAKDVDEEIRFLAANELAKRQHPGCLLTFAGLLSSDVYAIRHQSHEALLAMTKKDFGYLSDAIESERLKPAELWRRWAEQFGETIAADYNAYVDYLGDDESPLRDE